MRKYRLDLVTQGKRSSPCLVPDENDEAAVYVASEVDARIAKLEKALQSAYSIWSHAQEDCSVADRMADVINEALQSSS